jgi:DNA-binding GntR family transcriptional regulator
MNTNLTSEPAGRRLAGELRRRIVSGDLPEGAQLPSSSSLQAEHGVSSTVVRDALSALKAEGYVIGQQGKGVFVATAEQRTASAGDESLAERVAALEARVQALEDARSA